MIMFLPQGSYICAPETFPSEKPVLGLKHVALCPHLRIRYEIYDFDLQFLLTLSSILVSIQVT